MNTYCMNFNLNNLAYGNFQDHRPDTICQASMCDVTFYRLPNPTKAQSDHKSQQEESLNIMPICDRQSVYDSMLQFTPSEPNHVHNWI